MKRAVFLLLFLGLFARPLLEFSGLKIASFYFFCRGSSFHANAVSLCLDKLTLYDFALEDPKRGSIAGKEATIWFWKRHIEGERVAFSVRELPSSHKKEGMWSWAVREGRLEGDGIAPVFFSADFSSFPSDGRGAVSLEWETGAFAQIALQKQEGKLSAEGEFSRFSPSFLTRWLGEEWKGLWTGKVALSPEQVLSGEWTFEEAGWENRLQGIAGEIDFSFPLEQRRFLAESSFRWRFEKGVFSGCGGSVSEILSEGMMTAGVGARISLQGQGSVQGKEALLRAEARAGYAEEKWMQVDASLGGALLEGRWAEQEGKGPWSLFCKGIGPWEAELSRALFSPFFPEIAALIEGWELERGALSLGVSGENQTLTQLEAAVSEGTVCSETFRLTAGEASVRYALGTGDGVFSLAQGKALFPESGIEASLQGEGRFEAGSMQGAFFSLGFGLPEGKKATLHLFPRGKWDRWETPFVLHGAFPGSGHIEGEWADGKWLWSLENGRLQEWTFSGAGGVGKEGWYAKWDQAEGPLASLPLPSPFLKPLLKKGRFETAQDGVVLWGDWKEGVHWALEGKIRGAEASFYSIKGEEIEALVSATPSSFSLKEVRGKAGNGLLYCPSIEKGGLFDIRLQMPLWDLVRLKGSWEKEEEIALDPEESFFFGAHLEEGSASWDGSGKLRARLEWDEAIASLGSQVPFLQFFPLQGGIEIQAFFDQGKTARVEIDDAELFYEGEKAALHAEIGWNGEKWKLEKASFGAWSATAEIALQERGVRLLQALAEKPGEFSAAFDARFDMGKGIDIRLHRVEAESSFLAPWLPLLAGAQGRCEASGHASWRQGWEIDLDVQPLSLSFGEGHFFSKAPLHIFAAPKQSLLIRGIDCAFERGSEKARAKIDLFSYGEKESAWILQGVKAALPASMLQEVLEIELLDHAAAIDAVGNFSASSDFSHLKAELETGEVALREKRYFLEKGRLLCEPGRYFGECVYTHAGKKIEIEASAEKNGAQLVGKLSLHEPERAQEAPLVFDWERRGDGGFTILSAEGSFGGVEALFHKEDVSNQLIGSARVDCSRLASFVPPDIAKVFRELKMGSGYEIKGRLGLQETGLSFEGLLSGKQCKLFGFQLKTVLGKIAWGPGFFSLGDLKISDPAGMMKIDRVAAWGERNAPWRLSIPSIAIAELRPSLLQKWGEKLGPMTPLVVRNLSLRGLEGELEKSHTWTAVGDLKFINSFKREYTLADIPSDVLSRIFGLDLELLIPVRGQCKFALEGGLFRLKELEQAYSEGERSEFFLVEEGNSPTMDLDGNLQIWIKMKQFVLFKFTESFLISIEGKLDEPKFRLKKKKGFLHLSEEQVADL